MISHLGKQNDAEIGAWDASLAHLCNTWHSKPNRPARLELPAALSVVSVDPSPTAPALCVLGSPICQASAQHLTAHHLATLGNQHPGLPFLSTLLKLPAFKSILDYHRIANKTFAFPSSRLYISLILATRN